MATQHTFVVTSNSYIPGPADPIVTLVGTVDGFPVTVTLWLSAYNQAYSSGLPILEALVANGYLALCSWQLLAAPPNAQAACELAF